MVQNNIIHASYIEYKIGNNCIVCRIHSGAVNLMHVSIFTQ